jgi:hypothetical protein
MSPAQYVSSVFGGVRATARAIKRHPSAVSKWTSTGKQGTGGHIPAAAARLILTYARKHRLDIKPEDLVIGRVIPRKKKKRAS